MRARRVAVLADVHGNAVALEAVLEVLEREEPHAIVRCGDLSWGPLVLRDPPTPAEVIAHAKSLAFSG